MKLYELKEQALILNAKEQAQLKGGTGDSNTTNSILIGDIDVI